MTASNDTTGQGSTSPLAPLRLHDLLVSLERGRSQAEVEPLIERARAALDGTRGRESYDVAAAAHELAVALGASGRVEAASDFYERALEAKRRLLGSKHPELATTLHNLAVLYDAQGQGDQARALWAEAGAILTSSGDTARPPSGAAAGATATAWPQGAGA